jgi:hypothetical protein
MAQNIADDTQVRNSEQRGKRLRERELDDIKRILETDFGRRFVWRYLGLAGVFQTSFTGNSTTFFNEGKRDIGLKLLADITEAKPEAYLQMTNEAKKSEENNA